MALPGYQQAEATAKAAPKKRGRKPATGSSPNTSPANEAARAASAGPPAKKRAKATTEGDAVTGAMAAKVATIAAAVKEASGLPASVRDMLCSALPDCCYVNGPLQPSQEKTLRMLSLALNDVDAARFRKMQDTTRSWTKANEELERQKKAHAGASAALTASSACAKVKEFSLSENVRALQSSQLALDTAQTEINTGDALIGGSLMKSEQLSQEKAQDKSPAETGELMERIDVIKQRVSELAVARVALVAKLNASQAAFDAATAKQKACVEALARAKSEKQEHANAVKAAACTLKEQKVAVAEAVKERQTAEKKLAEFRKRPLATFKSIAKQIEQQYGVRLSGGPRPSMGPQISPEAILRSQVLPETVPKAALLEEHKSADAAPCAPPAPAPCPEAVGEDDKLSHCEEPVPKGTPVIDRKHQQAVLRRRSAALPTGFFTRLSLMARRSSMVTRPRSSADTADTSYKTCDSDSELEETTGSAANEEAEQQKKKARVFDEAMVVPTPNRTCVAAED